MAQRLLGAVEFLVVAGDPHVVALFQSQPNVEVGLCCIHACEGAAC